MANEPNALAADFAKKHPDPAAPVTDDSERVEDFFDPDKLTFFKRKLPASEPGHSDVEGIERKTID